MHTSVVATSPDSNRTVAARPCRIWILEDHDAIRQLLGDFVALHPQWTLAGASTRGKPMVEACARGEVDVVLLDLILEGRGGLKVLEDLAAIEPRPKVIVFSAVLTVHSVQSALCWGVNGYIEKAAPLPELEAAIERAAQGGVYLSERVSAIARSLVSRGHHTGEGALLTPRDLRVLELVARGTNTKALARVLGLSEPATYRLKGQVAAKLNAQSDQELTLIALRMGLISAMEEAGPVSAT